MATLMSGSAVRLPRALPSWLRVKRAPRDVASWLLVGLIGAALVWQCVSLLWTLIVPLSPLARFFRDCAGRANQRMAAAADEVHLVVSGIHVCIKGGRSGPCVP